MELAGVKLWELDHKSLNEADGLMTKTVMKRLIKRGHAILLEVVSPREAATAIRQVLEGLNAPHS